MDADQKQSGRGCQTGDTGRCLSTSARVAIDDSAVRKALLKPLQMVSGIVERRHTLPILANVLLEQRAGHLYVTATDLEMLVDEVVTD